MWTDNITEGVIGETSMSEGTFGTSNIDENENMVYPDINPIGTTDVFSCDNEECVYNDNGNCKLGVIELDEDGYCKQIEWTG